MNGVAVKIAIIPDVHRLNPPPPTHTHTHSLTSKQASNPLNHLLTQSVCLFLQLENHPLDRKTFIVRQGEEYVVNRIITQGEVRMKFVLSAELFIVVRID